MITEQDLVEGLGFPEGTVAHYDTVRKFGVDSLDDSAPNPMTYTRNRLAHDRARKMAAVAELVESNLRLKMSGGKLCAELESTFALVPVKEQTA